MTPDRRALGWRRGLLAWFLFTTVIAGSLLGVAWPGSSAPARAATPAGTPGKPVLGPNQAEATVPGPGPMKAIPNAFLGLSTEFTTLPLVEKHIALYRRVLEELNVRFENKEPLVLRIGGDSAEHVRFGEKIHFPPWAFKFDKKVARNTIGVMDDLKLRVIVDINTISSNPREVAAWMKDFTTSPQLDTGQIVAFELGNEPDIYDCVRWGGGKLEATDQSTLKKPKCRANLPKRITATSFARSFQRYARALHSAAPTVPVIAPALAKATTDLGWIKTLLHRPHPGLRVISAHVYPYSACDHHPWQPHYPTISRILSENATAGMARTVAPAIRVAHQAGLSLRLTEINSVTCGGRQGVSDTFATALWAPDAVFELMNAGVEGVNLHARVRSINRPFSFTREGLETRPLLYGLILFTRMLKGSIHPRLVPVTLRSGRSSHLKVWAVRTKQVDFIKPIPPDALKVLVLNKGRRSARITLHLPTRSPGFVERLLAPSASSTSGVTLDGQQLNHRGLWQGKRKLQTLRPTRNGSYVLRVRGESAAVLTVGVAASTLDAPGEKAAGPSPLVGYL